MRRQAATVALVLAAGGFGGQALANCQSSHAFSSGRLISRTNPPVLTTEFTGVWWQIGYGDTRLGAGNDSGSFPPGELSYYGSECYYAQGCWLYIEPYGYSHAYTGVYMTGDWREPRVDGCVDDVPGTACMAAAFSDQRNGQGLFTLLTDAEDTSGNFSFRPSTTTLLRPIPVPVPSAVTDTGGTLTVSLNPITAPSNGLFLDPNASCAGAVRGFKIHQKTVPPGTQPPFDRRRDGHGNAAPWPLTHGGEASGGAPHPDGVGATVTPIGCVDGGSVVLATSLVFDSGFTLRHLSGNSVAIPCGICTAVDADGDGARTDKCATEATFDCDGSRAEVRPGAPQICDGLNNDCAHAGWPALEGTNEHDGDGDGVTECAGDSCPRDPLDDADLDGACADVDNCPALANPGQEDRDQDGKGDPCDPCPDSVFDDQDGDGLCGDVDICPVHFNPGQEDADEDDLGDPCDACPLDPDNDLDGDGRCGNVDSCPRDPANDADRDGICGDVDACPLDAGNDRDADSLCGNVDNCPGDPNPAQQDGDGDHVGDACDRFAPRVTVTDGYTRFVNAVAAGDLDGDGDADVAAVSFDRLDYYENVSGDGKSWQKHTVGSVSIGGLSATADLGIADMDGDGALDIVHMARGISWLENDGVGGLFTRHSITTTDCGGYVEIVDFDADGDPDLVLTDLCAAAVVLAENAAGDGTSWVRRTLANLPDLRSVAVADADGDGDLDLFAGGNTRWVPTVVQLLLNDGGAASFTPVPVAGSLAEGTPRDLEAADLDGDGDVDVMAATHMDPMMNGHLQWYENRGAGTTWLRHRSDTEFGGFGRVVASDVDGDGDLDAVTGGEFPVILSWEENRDGRGLLWERRRIAATRSFIPEDVALPDLDGDGDPDLVAPAYEFFGVEAHLNVGLPWPIARAGPDQTIECAGPLGAFVTLDGSGSTHPDGIALTYRWTGPFPEIVTLSPTVDVMVPPGSHAIVLRVSDATGAESLDTVIVSIVEPAGMGAVSLAPSFLWPPNHRLVPVSATMTGTCALGLALVSALSSEPDDAPGGRDGMTTEDIGGAAPGTPDTELLLRAERDTGGAGRVYTLTWEVDDGAGGRRSLTGAVSVPLHPGGPADPIDVTAMERPNGTLLEWSPHPAGSVRFNVIRGSLGMLAFNPEAGGTAQTGSVACLGSGLSAPNTIGWEDPSLPPAGQGWFYLVESVDSSSGLRSGYGTESGLWPIVVTSGDCGR